MKKILAWIAGIAAAVGAILLLLSSSRKKKKPISTAVAPDYKPEEFKKETAAKVEEVKAASKEEIVGKFKKRFGG
jgi:hypothetical protein